MTGDMDKRAVDLANCRLLAANLQHHESQPVRNFALRFQMLDDAGVFAGIDEHTGYAPAEVVIAQRGR